MGLLISVADIFFLVYRDAVDFYYTNFVICFIEFTDELC